MCNPWILGIDSLDHQYFTFLPLAVTMCVQLRLYFLIFVVTYPHIAIHLTNSALIRHDISQECVLDTAGPAMPILGYQMI